MISETVKKLRREIGHQVEVTDTNGTFLVGRLWHATPRSIWLITADGDDWFIPLTRIQSWQSWQPGPHQVA